MGNIYRFVEPVLLLMLKEKGRSYGYDLASNLSEYALTDAQVEGAALYRTLRRLESNGHVKSSWDTSNGGPARRIYSLTSMGDQHLREWAEVLGNLGSAMSKFRRRATGNRVKQQNLSPTQRHGRAK
jgi:PadR family transcriptional regulator PadR